MMKNIFIVVGILFLAVECNEIKRKTEMDTIELSNGMTMRCKTLTKVEYYTLLKTANSAAINPFKEKYNIDVHQLYNSQVLVKESGYYTLYYKFDDLEKVLLDVSGNLSGQEVLLNKNPYANAFPSKTDSLIQDLFSLVKIPRRELNAAVLKIIDDNINTLPDADLFKQEHFLHLIALIGETLVKKYRAEWEMKLSSDGLTWNPYLKIKNQQIQFFTYLYEDIFLDHKVNASLVEVYKTANDIVKNNLD